MTAAVVDLRTTYGWRLTPHARKATRERGIAVAEILTTILQPDIVHTAYNYGTGRYVYKRGDLAVVVVPATKSVITVLWNTAHQWTNAEFREHRLAS